MPAFGRVHRARQLSVSKRFRVGAGWVGGGGRVDLNCGF